MGKTLYGKVEKNEFNYEWKSEPGACEVCQKMDGTIYESADDIPAKPHPNCKCWINLVEKEKPSPADPIEARRAAAKDRINAQKELAKLHGDVRVIQDEVEIYINDLQESNNEFEKLEKMWNSENVSSNTQKSISKVKEDINSSINAGEKLAEELVATNNEIIILQGSVSNNYNAIENIKKKITKLKHKIEAELQKKEVLDKCIESAKNLMPVSAALWKISSSKFEDGLDYIQQNGKIYNSLEEIKDKNTREFVRNKIKQQYQSKDSRGIIFNSNSEIANKLASSRALVKYISNNSKKFQPNTTLSNTSLEFDILNPDLYNALHRADIIDIKIDASGTFTAKIIDTYDFNPNSNNWLVKWARMYQENGEIENYYTVVNIKIPKKVWEKY